MAEPIWNPCVHSVQPRAVYMPLTVKTGALLPERQRRFQSAQLFCREPK